MRILCFGKHGLLSSELQTFLPELQPAAMQFLSKSDCDITDEKAVRLVFKRFQPTHVINAAAYTDVDGCEANGATANMINGFALDYIIEGCHSCDATLIHFSTDYVFNGKKEGAYDEDDDTLPINAYGESKLIGEKKIREQLLSHYIIRIQWVFGTARKNFISSIVEATKTQSELRVVNDQFGSPTSTTSISKAVVNLMLNKPVHGTYHFRSLNHTSWYDYASFVLDQCNIKVPIIPVSSHEYRAKAKRPKNGVLNIAKWIYSDLYTPPTWTRDVMNYLNKKKYIKEK